MRTKRQLSNEQVFLLDAAFGRLEAAQRGLDQATAELGRIMRGAGLSASARHFNMSKQWALQLAQRGEKTAREGASGAGAADLAESIRRLGVLEPITVEVEADDLLRVTDGLRRLRAAREAGISSLPVMLTLVGSPPQREETHAEAGPRRRSAVEVLQGAKEELGSEVFPLR